MDDLMGALESTCKDLDTAMKMLRKNGNDWALKSKEYNVAKYETSMRLRDGGMPVTMIESIIKGHPDVADKLYERDLAYVMYDSNKEAINKLKRDLGVIENQINREWHSNE